MRQRVMIAMALSCNPKLLIADEPTTALDVTIQAQILDLMRGLQTETGAGVIMITHSMGVVAGMADRVQVMYAGHIVETATTEEIFANPRHPYTVGLMKSIPRLDARSKEKLQPIRGLPPDLIDLPDMCPFVPRCNYAREKCEQKNPPLLEVKQRPLLGVLVLGGSAPRRRPGRGCHANMVTPNRRTPHLTSTRMRRTWACRPARTARSNSWRNDHVSCCRSIRAAIQRQRAAQGDGAATCSMSAT